MLPTFLQALFSSETRLYALAWQDEAGPEMAVEAWWGKEELSGGFEYIIDLLSTDARIPESKLLGRVVTLSTTLSDGSKFKRSGGVRSVIKLGSDGGFAWCAARGGGDAAFTLAVVEGGQWHACRP